MTTIEKLGLSGIRSYGPDKEAIIKFKRPLTIILGTNGSGKSSIIESVKMATTGEMPPMVSNGSAFINDPRIKGRAETQAKIRLQFTNVRGEEYLVSRHFLLKMTRTGAPVFKTVDQTLKKNAKRGKKKKRRDDDGEDDDDDDQRRDSTSHRCADLNALLPELMRVTKPILNSVIFVHQEDSLWPLGDPKKLKERFDDIFSATRYTKALECIRKFRKEQAAELRVVNSELLRYEDRYKEAEKLRDDMKDFRMKDKGLRMGVAKMNDARNKVIEEQNKAAALVEKYNLAQEKLTEDEAKIGVQEDDRKAKMNVLIEDLSEMDDVELKSLIADLDDAMSRFESEKRDRNAGLEAARSEYEAHVEAFNSSYEKLGTYRAEANQQKRRLKQLEVLKSEFMDRFFTGPESQASVVAAVPSLTSDMKDWSAALKSLYDHARSTSSAVAEERRKVEDAQAERVNEAQGALSEKQANMVQFKQTAAKTVKAKVAVRDQLRQISTGSSQADVDEARAAEKEWGEKARVEAESGQIKTATAALKELKSGLRALREGLGEEKQKRDGLARDNDARIVMQQNKKSYLKAQEDLGSKTEDFLERVKLAYAELDIGKRVGDDGTDEDDDDEVYMVGSHSGDEDALKEEKQRKESLKLADRIVSFRERAAQEGNAKLVAMKKELHSKTGAAAPTLAEKKRCENSLAQLEKRLVALQGKLTDEMRKVVSDSSENNSELIATTSSSLDCGSVTMTKSNCAAVEKVEEVAVEQVRACDAQLKTAAENADMPENIKNNLDEHGTCVSCGHAPDLDPEVTKSDCVDARSAQEEDAQIAAIKKYAHALAEKALASQRAYADDAYAQASDKELLEEWSSDNRQLKKVTVDLVKWAKEMAQVGREFIDLDPRLKETRSEANAVTEAIDALGQKVAALEVDAKALNKQNDKNSEASNIQQARTELFRLVNGRDSAHDAYQKSLKALPKESASITLDEIDKLIRGKEKELSKTQENMEEKRNEVETAKDDLTRVNDKYAKAREQALIVAANFEAKARLEKERQLLTEEQASLEKEVTALKELMPAFDEKLRGLKKEFDEIREQSRRVLSDAQNDVLRVEKAKSSWEESVRDVESFVQAGKEGDLPRQERHMETTRAKKAKYQEDVSACTRDVEQANGKVLEKTKELRNATDNSRLRDLQKVLEMLRRGARDSRAAIEDSIIQSTAIASRLVKEKPEGVEEGKIIDDGSKKRVNWGGKQHISRMEPAALHQELMEQSNDLNAVMSATKGQAQVWTERYMTKKKEVEEADRMGSMKKYEECSVTKQTMELASSDLDRYHSALDQALMSFHALKMDTINKSIRELWQTTYRGNDIDEIEIMSDGDGTSGKAATAITKRNYNYRVMMRRGDAKLDMRGRCSAGQKVLACLVIRLALAESFCTDCGILALDEPTTNLDADNVDSLAGALRSIIEARRRQAHFQLVVISHDQDFLTKLGARSFCDEYYLVHKDADGFSSVKPQDIRQLED